MQYQINGKRNTIQNTETKHYKYIVPLVCKERTIVGSANGKFCKESQ